MKEINLLKTIRIRIRKRIKDYVITIRVDYIVNLDIFTSGKTYVQIDRNPIRVKKTL